MSLHPNHCWVLIAALLSVAPVRAEMMQITAEFRPDPSRPHVNEFKNTTSDTGYCLRQPSECKRWGIFSLATAITHQSDRPIVAKHGNPRQGAMFNVPAGWRDVSVTDETGLQTAVVQVRIAGIGDTYRLSQRVQELIGEEQLPDYVAHNKLWREGDWLDAPAPCANGPYSESTDMSSSFFWMTPVVGVCSKRADYDIPELAYDNLNFAYQLKTPNPLTMAPGTYRGTTLYTVGAGGDFDMGDIMRPSDGSLVLDFTLTVEHVLAVEIPPGGNQVQLVPQGGWQAWLQQSRKPTRLFRDQTFNLWTSTPFKMQLGCSLEIGNTCALQDAAGNRVPVDVAVTLPPGMTSGGQAVNRRPLLLDGQGTEKFEPGLYVVRKPGTLHFSVEKDGVRQMLELGSERFSGDVTVIWDSEV